MNKSSLLTGLAIVGVAATTLSAIKATPKAMQLVEQAKRSGDSYSVEPAEVARIIVDCYVPTTLLGFATISCIVGIHVTNRRVQAVLSSAYGLYREAANAVYGPNADSRILAKMADDVWVYVPGGDAVYDKTMDKDTEAMLFYDPTSNRHFWSTIAAVLNAQYHINRNLQLRGYVPLNEYYAFLGIPETNNGDNAGWSIDNMIDYMETAWIDFNNYISKEPNGQKKCVLWPSFEPRFMDV